MFLNIILFVHVGIETIQQPQVEYLCPSNFLKKKQLDRIGI